MSEFRHGVGTLEKETGFKQVVSAGSVPIFVIASAIHLATEPKVNEAILCYSMDEIIKYFGYVDENTEFSLNRVVDVMVKAEGYAPIGIINILDPAKHKTDVLDKAVKLVNAEYTEEIQGVMLSTVVVKEGTTVLVENTDYYKQYTSAGFIKITKVTGGAITGVDLKLSYSKVDSSKILPADVIGGRDLVTGKATGMELLDSFSTVFNVDIKSICIPKYSKDSAVKTLMGAKAVQLDCISLPEIPDDVYYLNAPQKKKDMNIFNPTEYCTYGYGTLGEKLHELSIHTSALLCRVDKNNLGNPCESPSNKKLNVDGACIVVGGIKIPLNLGKNEGNYLNQNGIATLINQNGFVLWGNQTAAYPGNVDPKDTTINWKRGMQFYRKAFEKSLASSIDGKVTKRFLDTVLNTWRQNFNAEAAKENIFYGEIICNPAKNTVGDLIVGTLTYSISLTFYSNAQAIIGEFGVDVDKLNKLIG